MDHKKHAAVPVRTAAYFCCSSKKDSRPFFPTDLRTQGDRWYYKKKKEKILCAMRERDDV